MHGLFLNWYRLYENTHTESVFIFSGLQVYLLQSHSNIRSIPTDYMCWFKLKTFHFAVYVLSEKPECYHSTYCTGNQYFLLWSQWKQSPLLFMTTSFRICLRVRACAERVMEGWRCGAVVSLCQIHKQSPVARPCWAELFQCSHMVNISKNMQKHTQKQK